MGLTGKVRWARHYFNSACSFFWVCTQKSVFKLRCCRLLSALFRLLIENQVLRKDIFTTQKGNLIFQNILAMSRTTWLYKSMTMKRHKISLRTGPIPLQRKSWQRSLLWHLRSFIRSLFIHAGRAQLLPYLTWLLRRIGFTPMQRAVQGDLHKRLVKTSLTASAGAQISSSEPIFRARRRFIRAV